MLFSDIAILDENFGYHEHQWVGVADDRIAFISDAAPSSNKVAEYGEVYDGRGKLLMSAFYNAHAHAPMTLLRGYAEGLPLQAWLFDKVIPFEDKMGGEDAYWATLLACAEMARFGIVSFSDMYFHTGERIQAVVESGLKANISHHFAVPENKSYRDYPQSAFNDYLIETYHESAEGRIRIDLCIHAEYTTKKNFVASLAQDACEKGLHIHTHISETKLEHEECKERQGGLTPVKYLNSLGVFDAPTTAAHCVWVEEEDMDIMAEKGVFVACNPASNMKLASGFAPIPSMHEKGIPVALGTDGMASNNNHDFLQGMHLMSLIYKGATLDPMVLRPEQVLNSAMRVGALSQGRDDCGQVKSGSKADLIVLDTNGPSWTPMVDPLSNIVFAGHGSDVCLTMSDGRIIYREGLFPTIDIERVKAEINTAAARIRGSL